MYIVCIAILLCLVSSPLSAQRGGGGFRGGGVMCGGSARAGSGFRGGVSNRTPSGYGSGFVGYNSPLYYGGFGYSGVPWFNTPPASYSPVYYEVTPPAPPAAPSVVINEYYRPATARPRMRDYSNGGYGVEPPARPLKKPENWLIAFPNGTIVIAVAYWTDRDTFHYVTRNKEPKQLPISGIDREITEQLNHERGLEFQIPK